MNRLETIRASYGLAQLLAPNAVARRLTCRNVDDRERFVTRVLGVRHLLQAAVLVNGSRRAHRLGAAVDALHAASMVGLALVDRSRRRQAWTSAATASAFAAAEYVLHGRPAPGRHSTSRKPTGRCCRGGRAAASKGRGRSRGRGHE